MRSFFKFVKNILFFAIVIGLIYFGYEFFQNNNFIDYTKSISKKDITEFKRDNNVKYSDERSFKIISDHALRASVNYLHVFLSFGWQR